MSIKVAQLPDENKNTFKKKSIKKSVKSYFGYNPSL